MRLSSTMPYIDVDDIEKIVKEIPNRACIAQLVGERFALIIRSGGQFRVWICGTVEDAIKASGSQLAAIFGKVR